MKKKLFFAVALLFGIFLTACGNNFEVDISKNDENISLLDIIEKAITYDEITSCYSNTNYQMYSDIEENALKERVFEYLLSSQKLNSIYFYNERFLEGTLAADLYGLNSKDTISIYVVSSNEIYIVPTSELHGGDINSIQSMENRNEYAYKAVNGTACDGTWIDGPNMTIDFVRLSDDYEVHIVYREDEGYITVYDCFPHQIDNEGREKTSGIRDYYLDETLSLKASQDAYDEAVQKKEDRKKLAGLEPKVGMTASEVRAGAWGEPDKINSDTYSWGTTEQW